MRSVCVCAGEAQFPFETAPSGLSGSRRTEGPGAGGGGGPWGSGQRGYLYNDGFGFEGGDGRGGRRGTGARESDLQGASADRRSEGPGIRGRGVPERDMFGQSSLERIQEENSSLRAITKYLIHERKELRRKADTAAKRNQNLNNLLQVMKWSLQQRSGSGVGSASTGAWRSSPNLGASPAENVGGIFTENT